MLQRSFPTTARSSCAKHVSASRPSPARKMGGATRRPRRYLLILLLLCVASSSLASSQVPASADSCMYLNVGDTTLVKPIQLDRDKVARIKLTGLNPFAGTFAVKVNERVYTESAVPAFIAALGVVLPTPEAMKDLQREDAAPTDTVRDDLGRNYANAVSPKRCLGKDKRNVEDVGNVLDEVTSSATQCEREFKQFLDVDAGRRRPLAGDITRILSPGSKAADVRAAFDRIASGLAYVDDEQPPGLSVEALNELVKRTEKAKERLRDLQCQEAKERRLEASRLLATIRQLLPLAAFREKRIAADRRARDYAAQVATEFPRFQQLFQQPVILGPYDKPTLATVKVTFTPSALPSPLSANPPLVKQPNGDDHAQNPPPEEGKPDLPRSSAVLFVRQYQFGHPGRFGLGATVVAPLGPHRLDKDFGGRFIDTSDTLKSAVQTRSRQVVQPLLDLSIRVWNRGSVDRNPVVTLHAGVAPFLQGQGAAPAYFLGGGLSFLDEKLGVLLGWFNFPTRELTDGTRLGDKLHKEEEAPRTTETRQSALAVGVSLRAF